MDVFFVISGYLITKGLLVDLDKGEYSIGNFYVRRIRRIFPAYLAVILFTLILGCLLYYGKNLEILSKTAFKSSVFLTNIHFAKFSGYFSPDAHGNALLNLWSLSVEEQFYIFFPLILAALYKWKHARIKITIWLLTIISLIASIYMVNICNEVTDAFYWLPYRSWELLAGCLLAIHKRDSFISSGIGFPALVILCLAFFYYSEALPFPGLMAIVPILCAVILLSCGNYGLAKPIMENKVTVFFGKISYSLYLFHWPLLVFCRHSFNRILPETVTATIAVILSLILSILSWKIIETPVRRTRWANKKYYIFGLSVIILTIGLSQLTKAIAKYEIKHPHVVLEDYWDGKAVTHENYQDPTWPKSDNRTDNTFTVLGTEQNFQYVLWGDSHAMALSPGFHEFSLKTGINGIYINRKHTLLYDTNSSTYPENAEWIDTVLSWLEQHKELHTVILVNRWAVRAQGFQNENGTHQTYYRRDKITGSSNELFNLGLKQLCEKLKNMNKNVVILSSVPEQATNVPSTMDKGIFGICRIDSIAWENFTERQKEVNQALKDIESKRLAKIIWIDSYFYENAKPVSLLMEGNKSMYTDDDHLSPAGACWLLKKIRNTLTTSITEK